MGIELERFVNVIDDEFICTICCCVLEHAVQISQCEHTFCSKCIEEWIKRQTTCPIDRNEIKSDDLKPASRLLNSFLNRLNIRCDFNEFGCNSIITLESLSAHVSQCNYNPEKALPCEKGCGILLTVKQKSGHNCVLEDILVTIDNQNERIANLEKILEKNNAFIHQRLEALEKKNDSFKQLEIKYKFLENKYERLASCVSQLTLNSSGLNTGILALEENQSLSTSNAESTSNHETITQTNDNPLIEMKEKSSIFKTINVEVDHKLKTIQLWANIYEPISNIKSRIGEKENMSIHSQCLVYNDQLLSDDKTLSDYSISSTNLVLLKRPIKIDVIIFSENISFLLEPFETIANIKQKLFLMRGLTVSLSYFGQNLDDNRTLYSYKIRDRAKLKVTAINCNRDKS